MRETLMEHTCPTCWETFTCCADCDQAVKAGHPPLHCSTECAVLDVIAAGELEIATERMVSLEEAMADETMTPEDIAWVRAQRGKGGC